MAVITTITDTACKGLRASGVIPRDEKLVEAMLAKQLKSSGTNWTLDRVKSFTDWTLNNEASEKPVPLPDGFARNRRTGMPVGVLGFIQRQPLSTRLRILGAITSSFVEDEITDPQWEKWSRGVLKEKQDIPDPQRKTLVERLAQSFSELVDFDQVKKSTEAKLRRMNIPMLECMTGSSIPCGSESISIRKGGRLSYQKLAEAYAKQWEYIPNATLDYIGRLVEDDLLEGHKVLPDFRQFDYIDREELTVNYGTDTNSDIIGRIGYLQQPKNKLRAVANPNRIAQQYSVPFGEALQEQVDQDRFSFVKDQEGGHKFIQQLLRKRGGIAYSMDLSAATDTLNFDILAEALELAAENQGVDIGSHLDYFRDLSNGLWYSEESEKRLGQPYVTFQQGQPLGLRPSFPFLSLANAAMARTAIRESRTQEGRQTAIYACVGDDMMIYQSPTSRAAQIYSQLVTDLGSEANLSKTLTSSKMAEFCGKVITPSKIIAKGPKYKEPTGADALALVQNFGDSAYSLIDDLGRKTLASIRHIPRKKGGFFGVYKPRTDIREETAEFAYEAAQVTLDKDKFIGINDTTPSVMMNSALMRGVILPESFVKNDLNAEAFAHIPKIEDLESSIPEHRVFNYRTQSYEDPSQAMLAGILKVGKRSLDVLDNLDTVTEIRTQPEPYKGKDIVWAYWFDQQSKDYLLSAYRKTEEGDQLLYSQVDDVEFYRTVAKTYDAKISSIALQRAKDIKQKALLVRGAAVGVKQDNALYVVREDGYRTSERPKIVVSLDTTKPTLPSKASYPSKDNTYSL